MNLALRWAWLALLAIVIAACSSRQLVLDTDGEEHESKKIADVETIGDVTRVSGMEEVELYGVGIVRGLPGVGGRTEPGELRFAAINDLKLRGIEEPAKFLASPDTAVVVVRAVLPPGVRRGDAVDVDVELPPRDRTTSLRGGYLLECDLREYAKTSQGTKQGKVLARAKGPLLVGLGEGNDKDRPRRGRIWGGGKSLIDRDFYLRLSKDAPVNRSRMVAARINETFHDAFRDRLRGMAEAKTKTDIVLRVPGKYQHNLQRYLTVIRQIPLRESPVDRAKYQRDLATELLEPSKTVVAALKLEALGVDAVGDLKKGLEHTHPLVRFCSAEALAYLEEPACGEPLAQLIEQQPSLRAYALTALASLDQSVCHIKLRDLLSSKSTETRYGAFRALRALDEKDDAIRGEQLNDRFHLHCVAPGSSPLIHISSKKRAEIVLFGDEHRLLPPFTLQAGPEFVVKAEEGADHCIVARISDRGEALREKCPLRVAAVLRKLATMGAAYPDAVDLLREASTNRTLDCQLAIDALPRATSIRILAIAGAHETGDDAGEEVDLGAVPNLFARR